MAKKKESPKAEKDNEDDGPSLSDRMFFGGNFGLQFGNPTLIDISPLVGFRMTERLLN